MVIPTDVIPKKTVVAARKTERSLFIDKEIINSIQQNTAAPIPATSILLIITILHINKELRKRNSM